jgi:D-alanyl-D-alanine carboxypeptidase
MRHPLAASIAVAGAMAVTVAVAVSAAGPPSSIDAGAGANAPAVRSLPVAGDSVSVAQTSDLTGAVAASAIAAAVDVGAMAVPGRSASIGMIGVRRGATAVQTAPAGFQFPMGVTVLPSDAAAQVMSGRVGATLAAGQVVLARTSADLRGALAGDVVDMVAANGVIFSFVIGLIADDAEVGGTELVLAPGAADLLGATTVSRVLIWGFDSRAAIDAAMAGHGLERAGIRIGRSWSPPSPDSTLGLARTKATLGEFAYRVGASGAVSLADNWGVLHTTRQTYADIPIRATCHNVVVPALQGALSEVAASGLAGAIDVVNANTYGGCYYPRFNRVTGTLGFLSRHSWGMAFDTNTVANAQGAVPRMNCDVVRIFRKWGFAWGGNFTTPDGMHFEWVGERRDQLVYPSTYCPNVASGARTASPVIDGEPLPSAPLTARSTMFAGDGWPPGDDGDDHG